MTQILELSDKDSRAVIITMLQEVRVNPLEETDKMETISRSIINISYPDGGRKGYGREKRGQKKKKQLTTRKKCKLGNSENSQRSSFSRYCKCEGLRMADRHVKRNQTNVLPEEEEI